MAHRLYGVGELLFRLFVVARLFSFPLRYLSVVGMECVDAVWMELYVDPSPKRGYHHSLHAPLSFLSLSQDAARS